jgi:hybrid polyketide synthase/nonribosomal peptide synthetase ACE1
MLEPIAIIGAGSRFPGGADTPSKLWSVIHNPTDLSRKPSRFNIDPFYHPVGTHHGTTNAAKSYWLEDSGRSDVTKFDAGFFNIQPGEVDAMDPQQRLLLEVVYDGLCAAGQPMEKLRGSDTAVYVGMMCDDYNTMLVRDWESLPRYAATGLERAVVSNRVSYFFDWHGPSMTIDTACSSSMVALDMAVQALRSGKSRVAVAAGTSLILSPGMVAHDPTHMYYHGEVINWYPPVTSHVHFREQPRHALTHRPLRHVGCVRRRLRPRRGCRRCHPQASLPGYCR